MFMLRLWRKSHSRAPTRACARLTPRVLSECVRVWRACVCQTQAKYRPPMPILTLVVPQLVR